MSKIIVKDGKKYKRSDYCVNYSSVLINDGMTGKMRNIPVISTIYLCNDICISRMKDESLICHDCYAQQQTFKKELVINCKQNYEILNDHLLEDDEIPIFENFVDIVRIESYGDTGSVLHAENYIRIINANPKVTFAMWTKNPIHWDQAFKKHGKPKNLICVLSSIKKNEITELYKQYDWVDHVFTVFTLDYVLENKVDINCGGKVCRNCMNCYLLDSSVFFINELEKKDQNKATKLGIW